MTDDTKSRTYTGFQFIRAHNIQSDRGWVQKPTWRSSEIYSSTNVWTLIRDLMLHLLKRSSILIPTSSGLWNATYQTGCKERRHSIRLRREETSSLRSYGETMILNVSRKAIEYSIEVHVRIKSFEKPTKTRKGFFCLLIHQQWHTKCLINTPLLSTKMSAPSRFLYIIDICSCVMRRAKLNGAYPESDYLLRSDQPKLIWDIGRPNGTET